MWNSKKLANHLYYSQGCKKCVIAFFIGWFCVVFHCNTYELYRQFSIQIVIHIGLYTKVIVTINLKLI